RRRNPPAPESIPDCPGTVLWLSQIAPGSSRAIPPPSATTGDPSTHPTLPVQQREPHANRDAEQQPQPEREPAFRSCSPHRPIHRQADQEKVPSAALRTESEPAASSCRAPSPVRRPIR